MNKSGPIVVIEDDKDDQEILQEIFNELGYLNEIVFFLDGEKALEYVNKGNVFPFLILSDINMPKLSGLDLKKKIHTDAQLQYKCIPYLFFTTSAGKKSVIDAYSMSAQGFFIKQTAHNELVRTIKTIVEYWQLCYAPNQYLNE